MVWARPRELMESEYMKKALVTSSVEVVSYFVF